MARGQKSRLVQSAKPWPIRNERAFQILLLVRCRLLTLNRNQLDFKDEGGTRRDNPARATRAIGQIRRDKELPFRSHRHELQRLSPALDDATDWKSCRLAPLVRTVKLSAA